MFRSSEASRLSGLSLRQLQWWDEHKILQPAKEGHNRIYSAEQILRATLIRMLRERGVTLQPASAVTRANWARILHGARVEMVGYLIVWRPDSFHISGRVVHDKDSVIDVIRASKYFVTVIDLRAEWRRIAKSS